VYPGQCGAGPGEFVRVGGRRLRVRRTGYGPPLLLLNGVAMSLATWDPLVRELDGFDCIGVAVPGFLEPGRSQPVLTMRGFATLIRDLLDQLGVERADVLGLSFGGMVAQQLALDAPERVGSLVLVSTSCGLGGVPSNPLSWWNAVLQDGSPLSAVWGPLWLARQWTAVLRREFGAGWAHGLSLDGLAQQFASAALWSSLPWLPKLEQDVLIVAGTADALVPPQNANILASRMPRSQIYRVGGGGHLCLLDRVGEVGPVIAEFLRSGETAAIDEAV